MNKDGTIHIQNIGGGTFVSKSDFDRSKELTKTIVNTPKDKKRKQKEKPSKKPKKKGTSGICPTCKGRGFPVVVYLSILCKTCGGGFWHCPSCDFLNYLSWATCAKCDTPQPAAKP